MKHAVANVDRRSVYSTLTRWYRGNVWYTIKIQHHRYNSALSLVHNVMDNYRIIFAVMLELAHLAG